MLWYSVKEALNNAVNGRLECTNCGKQVSQKLSAQRFHGQSRVTTLFRRHANLSVRTQTSLISMHSTEGNTVFTKKAPFSKGKH